ncbi:MAG TPA: TadE/TadG family type IV pilus assembly protein [Caulobacteraceae bacterium]|jgi:Flp pilus assembly protein TadG
MALSSNGQGPGLARRFSWRDPRGLPGDRSGAQAVEFALIAPLLIMLIMGTVQFSIALNNYIELTEAVRTGGRTLAISRAMASATPYSTAVSNIKSSAGNLTPAHISITMSVNGTACATDSACSTALSAAAGQTASVSATYPCNLTVIGFNFVPHCTLSSQTSDLVE